MPSGCNVSWKMLSINWFVNSLTFQLVFDPFHAANAAQYYLGVDKHSTKDESMD